MPSLQVDTLKIRKEIKHLMIDLDLDRPGSYDIILPHLKKKSPTINKNKIAMAMTGFMGGKSYQRVLVEMKKILNAMKRGRHDVEIKPGQPYLWPLSRVMKSNISIPGYYEGR